MLELAAEIFTAFVAANDRELILTHQELTFSASVACSCIPACPRRPVGGALRQRTLPKLGPSSDRSYETRHVRVGVTTASGVSLASTTIPG